MASQSREQSSKRHMCPTQKRIWALCVRGNDAIWFKSNIGALTKIFAQRTSFEGTRAELLLHREVKWHTLPCFPRKAGKKDHTHEIKLRSIVGRALCCLCFTKPGGICLRRSSQRARAGWKANGFILNETPPPALQTQEEKAAQTNEMSSVV